MTLDKWCSAEKPTNSCSLLSMPNRGVDQRCWIFVRSNASTHLVGLTLPSTCAWERANLFHTVLYERSTFSMEACSSKGTDHDDLATIRQLTLSVRAHCAGPVPVHTEIRQRAVLRCEDRHVSGRQAQSGSQSTPRTCLWSMWLPANQSFS